MDVKSMRSSSSSSQIDEDYSSSRKEVADDHEEGPLPGFRFHPTDEELVSFYLKRKIEKRPLSIEIIKNMDIYKHDPWDLPKASSSVGDKEWYFYCKRGRKYRNSVRPNRVTGSGFWKATGIDRPIYSNGGEGHQCVGLKKSLVYYRGSAGKGTKTDWMMHEFRLPTQQPLNNEANSSTPKDTASFEAEIWTLCRIFKRNKRQNPDWKDLSARRNAVNSCSKSSSIDSNTNHECYISFATHPSTPNNIYYTSARNNSNTHENDEINVNIGNQYNNNITSDQKSVVQVQSVADYDDNWPQWNSLAHPTTTPATLNNAGMDFEYDLRAFYGSNWDDLNYIVEHAVRTTPLL